ncbi:MAG: hypothetical protein OXU40_07560 [Nitrospira sp.]|nr:hypothetical protein [Nitrospira sp.]
MLVGLAVIVAYGLGMQMMPSVEIDVEAWNRANPDPALKIDEVTGALPPILKLVGLKVDEEYHYDQIVAFLDGRFDVIGRSWVSTPPLYHALVATMAWVVGDYSPTAVRRFSAILCFPALILFFLCARALDKDNRVSLSLLFFLCPIFFPFFFVIYTNMLALLFLLGALWLTLARRYQLAGLVVGLAILVRQTEIVWAFVLGVIAMGQQDVWRRLVHPGYDWKRALRAVRPVGMVVLVGKRALRAVGRVWMFGLVGVAFLAFVYWNGGVVLGVAQQTHRELGYLFPTQGYVWLFTMFFLFLPLHLWNVPRIGAMLGRRPVLWSIIVVGSFVVYLQTFWAGHTWNNDPYNLHNRVIIWMRQDVWTRSLAFLPMLWAACSLCVTPLVHRSFYWLYPAAILSVLPVALFEQRFFMASVMFFLLFAEWKTVQVDRLTLAMYVLATWWVYLGLHSDAFFL